MTQVPYALAGRRKIGLLGGSFNPAHNGHRTMSLEALKRLGLDQIWWLVSPQNPLKSSHGMAPFAVRLAQAKQVAHHPRILVTDFESRQGLHYTADVLFALRKRFPQTHFVWLMGADNMQQIVHWKDWQDIFRLVPIAVFRRPAYAVGRKRGKAAHRYDRFWVHPKHRHKLADLPPPAWLVLEHPLNSLSATKIRKEHPKWQQQKRYRP